MSNIALHIQPSFLRILFVRAVSWLTDTVGSTACQQADLSTHMMNVTWQTVPRMLHLMELARTMQAVILADQRISATEAYERHLVEEADPGKRSTP